jgi:methionyl-tRNA formyltransferase
MTQRSKIAVFFGSGPVAAASLEKLLLHTEVEFVITKPRPVHHKGDVPVLRIAKENNIPTITAHDKTSLVAALANVRFRSDYALLIDFGIIVTQEIIDLFSLGIINSHFSLLPHLRGADPISFTILEGAKKTGVSLMVIDTGLDTGKLLTHRSIPVSDNDTTPSLTEKLIELSDQLIQEYMPLYLASKIKPKNQPHPDRATYSRKLTKQDGQIDWQQPAVVIERQIRAFYDWPKSRTQLNSLDVIIRQARVGAEKFGKPGDYLATSNTLLVQTSDGSLSLDVVQPLGKKEMPIQAFLAGYRQKL